MTYTSLHLHKQPTGVPLTWSRIPRLHVLCIDTLLSCELRAILMSMFPKRCCELPPEKRTLILTRASTRFHWLNLNASWLLYYQVRAHVHDVIRPQISPPPRMTMTDGVRLHKNSWVGICRTQTIHPYQLPSRLFRKQGSNSCVLPCHILTSI